MILSKYKIIIGLLIVMGAFIGSVPMKKRMQGNLHFGQAIFDAEKGKTCRLDSGKGTALHLWKTHENPLFESNAPNVVHLLLHWEDDLKINHRYQLPHPKIDVCYWEKGDILMFHTFSAVGWIEFDQLKPNKFALGKLEIKLVKPHHNFSNSDYHFMGGDFKLSIPKQPEQ